jgi:hypothetical protein
MDVHCTLTCVWFVACSTEHVPSTACMLGGLQMLEQYPCRKKFSYFKGSLTRDFRIQFLDFLCSSNLNNTDDRFILFSVADPGCLSRIRLFSIPEPGSATLILLCVKIIVLAGLNSIPCALAFPQLVEERCSTL